MIPKKLTDFSDEIMRKIKETESRINPN